MKYISYASSQGVIETFWHRVFLSGYEYISIRDMCVSQTADRNSSVDDIMKVFGNADLQHLIDFAVIHGTLLNNKNLLHYLLKYRYQQNWEREVRENYLPITKEELMSRIPDRYEVIYEEHYVLPFFKQQVWKDFGIEIKDNTHLKLLLKRTS